MDNETKINDVQSTVSIDGKNFTPEFMADIKRVAIETIEEALTVAKGFNMPIVAVFVVENEPVDNSKPSSFCGVNCPLQVADNMLHLGMSVLSDELEKKVVAH